nr:MAG TPA: hypothetical protein [Caudoviricetes sp.]
MVLLVIVSLNSCNFIILTVPPDIISLEVRK